MSFGAEPAEGYALAHTVHIWPSQELIARSWHWSEAWHAAYEQAASEIGRAVAVCVLGGLPVADRPITMELPTGCVSFSVILWGTSIYVSITEFEGPGGPDAPGPDGGSRQPRPADGLVLGLRGTGKCFALVTFYGYLPPIPTGYIYSSADTGRAWAYSRSGFENTRNSVDASLKSWPDFVNRQLFSAGKGSIDWSPQIERPSLNRLC